MPVHSKTYYGVPGLWYLFDPALANVKILHVARNGTTYYKTGNEEAIGLQYQYSEPAGGIIFSPSLPFADFDPPDSAVMTPLDRILVKYKVP